MGDICIKLSNSQKNLNLKNKDRAKHFIVVNDEDYYRLLKELKSHYSIEINSQIYRNDREGTGVDKRDIIYKLYAQLTNDKRFEYSPIKEEREEERLGINSSISLDDPESNLIDYLIQNKYIHIVSEDGGVVIDETSKNSYKVCTIDDFVECLQQDFAVLFEDNFREIYDEDLLIGIRKNLSLFESVSLELSRANDRDKFKKDCVVDSLQTKPGFRKACERIFIENENLREQEVRYLFIKLFEDEKFNRGFNRHFESDKLIYYNEVAAFVRNYLEKDFKERGIFERQEECLENGNFVYDLDLLMGYLEVCLPNFKPLDKTVLLDNMSKELLGDLNINKFETFSKFNNFKSYSEFLCAETPMFSEYASEWIFDDKLLSLKGSEIKDIIRYNLENHPDLGILQVFNGQNLNRIYYLDNETKELVATPYWDVEQNREDIANFYPDGLPLYEFAFEDDKEYSFYAFKSFLEKNCINFFNDSRVSIDEGLDRRVRTIDSIKAFEKIQTKFLEKIEEKNGSLEDILSFKISEVFSEAGFYIRPEDVEYSQVFDIFAEKFKQNTDEVQESFSKLSAIVGLEKSFMDYIEFLGITTDRTTMCLSKEGLDVLEQDLDILVDEIGNDLEVLLVGFGDSDDFFKYYCDNYYSLNYEDGREILPEDRAEIVVRSLAYSLMGESYSDDIGFDYNRNELMSLLRTKVCLDTFKEERILNHPDVLDNFRDSFEMEDASIEDIKKKIQEVREAIFNDDSNGFFIRDKGLEKFLNQDFSYNYTLQEEMNKINEGLDAISVKFESKIKKVFDDSSLSLGNLKGCNVFKFFRSSNNLEEREEFYDILNYQREYMEKHYSDFDGIIDLERKDKLIKTSNDALLRFADDLYGFVGKDRRVIEALSFCENIEPVKEALLEVAGIIENQEKWNDKLFQLTEKFEGTFPPETIFRNSSIVRNGEIHHKDMRNLFYETFNIDKNLRVLEYEKDNREVLDDFTSLYRDTIKKHMASGDIKTIKEFIEKINNSYGEYEESLKSGKVKEANRGLMNLYRNASKEVERNSLLSEIDSKVTEHKMFESRKLELLNSAFEYINEHSKESVNIEINTEDLLNFVKDNFGMFGTLANTKKMNKVGRIPLEARADEFEAMYSMGTTSTFYNFFKDFMNDLNYSRENFAEAMRVVSANRAIAGADNSLGLIESVSTLSDVVDVTDTKRSGVLISKVDIFGKDMVSSKALSVENIKELHFLPNSLEKAFSYNEIIERLLKIDDFKKIANTSSITINTVEGEKVIENAEFLQVTPFIANEAFTKDDNFVFGLKILGTNGKKYILTAESIQTILENNDLIDNINIKPREIEEILSPIENPKDIGDSNESRKNEQQSNERETNPKEEKTKEEKDKDSDIEKDTKDKIDESKKGIKKEEESSLEDGGIRKANEGDLADPGMSPEELAALEID